MCLYACLYTECLTNLNQITWNGRCWANDQQIRFRYILPLVRIMDLNPDSDSDQDQFSLLFEIARWVVFDIFRRGRRFVLYECFPVTGTAMFPGTD